MAQPRKVSPLFLLAAIVVAIAALSVAKEILLPFALAVLLSFLLAPLANRLERWGLGRIPSVLLVVAMTFMLLAGIGWIVTSQLIDLSREMSNYKDNIVQKVRTVVESSGSLSKVTKVFEEVEQEISKETDDEVAVVGEGESKSSSAATNAGDRSRPTAESRQGAPEVARHWLPLLESSAPRAPEGDKAVEVAVVSMPPSPLAQIQSWLGPIVAPLSAAGMIVVLLLFILIDRENQRNRLLQLFGSSNLHATTEAFGEASRRVSQYLRMQFLINACYGVCVALGLWTIGVPSALMWGVLGFSLRFLPYIGPWIAATLPVLVSLAVSEGWTQPMLVVGLYLTLELILNNFAEPWLYGGSIGVSTVGVIVSAIFWTWLWGPVGLVLAMPLTVCLVVMAQHVPQLRFISTLLADRPPMTLVERVYQRLLVADQHELQRLLADELKTKSLTDVYDDVMIPALSLAEHDRHADLLTDDQALLVEEMADDIVCDLAERGRQSDKKREGDGEEPDTTARPAQSGAVICIPLRDEADETCGLMLKESLAGEGISVELLSHEMLLSETIDRTAEAKAVVVAISILPPISQRETRLLWKRLRARFPEMPVVVGCWHSSDAAQLLGRIERDGPSQLVTTLADAVAAVKAAEARARLATAS